MEEFKIAGGCIPCSFVCGCCNLMKYRCGAGEIMYYLGHIGNYKKILCEDCYNNCRENDQTQCSLYQYDSE